MRISYLMGHLHTSISFCKDFCHIIYSMASGDKDYFYKVRLYQLLYFNHRPAIGTKFLIKNSLVIPTSTCFITIDQGKIIVIGHLNIKDVVVYNLDLDMFYKLNREIINIRLAIGDISYRGSSIKLTRKLRMRLRGTLKCSNILRDIIKYENYIIRKGDLVD